MLAHGDTAGPLLIGVWWSHARFEEHHVSCVGKEIADAIPCGEKVLQGPLPHDEFVVVELGSELLEYPPFAYVDAELNCVTMGSMGKFLLC